MTYLNGSYKEITFNQELHDRLIKQVMEKFNVVPDVTENENDKNDIEVDEDGFAVLSEDAVLPWDD